MAQLGRGEQGKIFLARDTRLDRVVAIKVYPARRQPKHEARVLSHLNHPHICTFYDAGQENGVDYFVFEYLEGQTVAERLRKGPIPVDQTLEYAIQIADALRAMHRQGISHGDLSPSNVKLTEFGAKLFDFDKARNRRALQQWVAVKAAKVKAAAETWEKRQRRDRDVCRESGGSAREPRLACPRRG